MLYNSLFYSHLIYAISIWGPSMQQGNIRGLFKSQKKAIRSIQNVQYNAPTAPLFRNLKILKVHDVIESEIKKFMYLESKNILPKPLLDLFVPNIIHHNYNTRGRHDPRAPHRTYAPMDKSFLC